MRNRSMTLPMAPPIKPMNPARFESASYSTPQHAGERQTDHDAESAEGMPLPAARVGQEGEGRARIEHVDEVEPGCQRHADPQRQLVRHDRLGPLVQHDEPRSQQQSHRPVIARIERPRIQTNNSCRNDLRRWPLA